MNTINKTSYMRAEQALALALKDTGIENSGYRCLSSDFDGYYFRIIIWTPYLKYEIYVDAEAGETAGIDTVPLSYREAYSFCSSDADDLAEAA